MASSWEPTGRALQELMLRCKEIGGNPPDDWRDLATPDLATAMRVSEARERSACDEIMRTLSRPGGVIGTPTPVQGYFCAMRCMCALDTLAVLHAEEFSRPLYPRPPQWPQEELLQWLLVTNWYQRHDTWLKLMAFAAATGRNFYSG